MKRIISALLVLFFTVENLSAQKIIPISFNGKKYEVLDMTSRGKVMWGGNSDEIPGDAAKSESDGAANTKAIVVAVGDNTQWALEGKPYAAKLCSEAKNGGKEDWYLPSKDETDAIYEFKDRFAVEERGTIWSSTEASGTQAVTKYWYTGAFYNMQKTESNHFVCIRKAD